MSYNNSRQNSPTSTSNEKQQLYKSLIVKDHSNVNSSRPNYNDSNHLNFTSSEQLGENALNIPIDALSNIDNASFFNSPKYFQKDRTATHSVVHNSFEFGDKFLLATAGRELQIRPLSPTSVVSEASHRNKFENKTIEARNQTSFMIDQTKKSENAKNSTNISI